MKKARLPKWAELKPLDTKAVRSLKDLSSSPNGTSYDYFQNISHLLHGYRTPGGCDLCNADYTMWPDPDIEGMTRITVFHDDDCVMIN